MESCLPSVWYFIVWREEPSIGLLLMWYNGYPFVIFDEEMSGIEKQDGVFVDMEWTGFHPTHKYANWDRQKDVTVADGVPVEQPLYTSYCQEDPHWTGEGWIEQVDKEMVYRLLPFGGNSTRDQVPVRTFWESGKDARELGVFVYDHNRWNDRQYGIWQPTPDLSVYFRYAVRNSILSIQGTKWYAALQQ